MARIDTARLIFIDFESSGLHDGSYPIEIGWARYDLTGGSMLIRPHDDWTDDDWDYRAEAIHGMRRRDVIDGGSSVAEVHAALMREIGTDGYLLSDNPYYEEGWMARLCKAVGAPVPEIHSHFDLVQSVAVGSGLSPKETRERTDRALALYPHRHRARPDALSLAAQVRAVRDPSFLAG